MAVNKTVNKRTNSHGAMRNCIEYVLRQDKTSEQFAYVTGPYCYDVINYDLVYLTFLEEKKLWNKDSGRMYAHNIISWHKDEQIKPEQAFEFGKEFAEKWFQGFQTLVAVHKDKDSREQYEMRTHKRLIDIKNPSKEVMDVLQRLDIPSGVDIQIKQK